MYLMRKNYKTASFATVEEKKEHHVSERSVSLYLMRSKLCYCITWILCPNAMVLSADTS